MSGGRLPQTQVVHAVWLVAVAVPVTFLAAVFPLTLFAAPQHDDYCFAYQYVDDGFIRTVLNFYYGLSGRVVPLFIIQLPAAITSKTGANLLSAYAGTMSVLLAVFVGGSSFAFARVWPNIHVFPRLFLSLAFAAVMIASAPSARDFIVWLPGVACYIPPALLSIFFLSELVRTIEHETDFRMFRVSGMAIGGFIAATCNEFTGAWLLVMLAGSLLMRWYLAQKLQIYHHLVIALAVLVGWGIVVVAPGNSLRMAAQPYQVGAIGHSLYAAARFSLICVLRLLREPTIIGWFAVVAAASLVAPKSELPGSPGVKLIVSVGLMAICLACGYFEFFAHEYSTGIPLVERAQNQAHILFLFGATISISLAVRECRPRILRRVASSSSLFTHDALVLPVLVAMVVLAAGLYVSPTAAEIRSQRASFYPYWRESVARDELLATSQDAEIAVPKHKWKPLLLMAADVPANIECMAIYYKKSKLTAVQALDGEAGRGRADGSEGNFRR
jgi:hypothetical protein